MPAGAAQHAAQPRTDSQLLVRLLFAADDTGIKLRSVAGRLQNFHLEHIDDNARFLALFQRVQTCRQLPEPEAARLFVMEHAVQQLTGVSAVGRFDQILADRMMGIDNLAGVQCPETAVITKKNIKTLCKRLDQSGMAALHLLGSPDENAYLARVFGAKCNDRIPFAVVHTAEDDPFNPV
ncbi:hypothetical protein D3C72_1794900 [compost metagenome]